jgi:DNA-binding transcriptional regulator YdaS (Cro superfamily)
MSPVAEAAYALDSNISRDDLRPEVQAEYDRLLKARREAAHALDSNISRDDLRPEVEAEYDRILQARRAREPNPESGMTIDDAQGALTIWHPGGAVLHADDHGVTVRTDFGGQRRVAWAEISRIEDRVGFDSEAGRQLLETGHRPAHRAEGQGIPHVRGAPSCDSDCYQADRRALWDTHQCGRVPMKVSRGSYHDPGLEEAATQIQVYEVQFVPGLLQTEDYGRAVTLLGHGGV